MTLKSTLIVFVSVPEILWEGFPPTTPIHLINKLDFYVHSYSWGLPIQTMLNRAYSFIQSISSAQTWPPSVSTLILSNYTNISKKTIDPCEINVHKLCWHHSTRKASKPIVPFALKALAEYVHSNILHYFVESWSYNLLTIK